MASDAGLATIEAVIIFPVLLFTTFLLVQAVLYSMANTAVTNGAQIGLETARAQSSSEAAGQSVLSQSSVAVSRGEDTVTVTAQGSAPSLVPFDLPQLRSHLSGPVEKVSAP